MQDKDCKNRIEQKQENLDFYQEFFKYYPEIRGSFYLLIKEEEKIEKKVITDTTTGCD